MVGGFGQELLAARAYFVHLAVVLVPLFLVGAFFVGLLREYLPPDRVERILRRYDGGSGNVVAAGTGAITPFCSASTVPVLAGLLGAGAPLGIAFSFLLASPLVNEMAVILLLGIVGVEATALYVLFTVVAAIIGGIVVGKLGCEHHVKDRGLLDPDDGEAVTDGGRKPTACEAGGVASDQSQPAAACGANTETQTGPDCGSGQRRAATHRVRVKRAAVGATGFFVDLLPYLLLGMTLGAVIHAFVPASFVRLVIGPENPFAVVVAAVAGAPIYVSMSAMLPIAETFTNQGIPIGTVLAFVVGSAGVSIPNLVLLQKLFDRTLLAVYALTVVSTGVTIGLVFNAFFL